MDIHLEQADIIPYELVEPTQHHTDVIDSMLDIRGECFRQISKEIWENPETEYQECLAHDILTAVFDDYGFRVHERFHLPTAFRAEYSKIGKLEKAPTIGLICEYDGLADIGHGCGHNLVSEAAIIASFALKDLLDDDPTLKGKIVVIGTPAAEGITAKLLMLRSKVFDDIDIMMMVHPGKFNQIEPWFPLAKNLKVAYTGLSAHSSSYPFEGKNALDSAVCCCLNLNMLKTKIREEETLQYNIIKGGVVPHTIPNFSEVELSVFSKREPELKVLTEHVERCCESAADAAGCEIKYETDDNAVDPFKTSEVLACLYKKYAVKYGLDFSNFNPDPYWLARDIGNVSQLVPSIRALFAINTEAEKHTQEFADAALTDDAQVATFAAGRSLAMVGLEIWLNPILVPFCKKDIKPRYLDSIYGRRTRQFSCLFDKCLKPEASVALSKVASAASATKLGSTISATKVSSNSSATKVASNASATSKVASRVSSATAAATVGSTQMASAVSSKKSATAASSAKMATPAASVKIATPVASNKSLVASASTKSASSVTSTRDATPAPSGTED